MGYVIHARKAEGGEIRFRIWSTSTDTYVSEELTEAEVRLWTLQDEVLRAIEEHQREIGKRIGRALVKGTSSLHTDTRNLDGPWNKEITDPGYFDKREDAEPDPTMPDDTSDPVNSDSTINSTG